MTPAPNSAVLDAPETPSAEHDVATESVVLEELLVEEISIDGMCGVY
jgi:mycofactocin precursor